MTTHATIRNGLRTLAASLLAACFLAFLAFPAEAGKSGGERVHPSEIVITKPIDATSRKIYDARTGTSGKTNGKNQKLELKNVNMK